MLLSRLTLLLLLFFTLSSVSAFAVENKRIALTFDDAPRGAGPLYTGRERSTVLIENLRAANAGPVAFFVTTKHLNKPGNRQRIQDYAAADHLIGNHSNSHSWLKKTDTDQYLQDIDLAEKLLNGIPNRRPWFRFPFLDEGRPVAQRDAVRAGLDKRGLMNGYVTIDNYDWYLESKWKQAVEAGLDVDLYALRSVYIDMLLTAANYYDDVAKANLKRSPNHVLLLHENDLAAAFIDDLIAALRADGWQIISPDDAYRDPIADTIPETLMTNQGHVAALAVDAGVDPRTLSHLGIEQELIDQLLRKHEVFRERATDGDPQFLRTPY